MSPRPSYLAKDTTQSRILAMCHAIRCFQQEVQIVGFHSVPKIYFEFADFGRMKAAEAQIMRAFEPLYPAHGEGKRRLDRDAIEMEIVGVTVVLRCLSRFAMPDGTDRGYTEVKFLTTELEARKP